MKINEGTNTQITFPNKDENKIVLYRRDKGEEVPGRKKKRIPNHYEVRNSRFYREKFLRVDTNKDLQDGSIDLLLTGFGSAMALPRIFSEYILPWMIPSPIPTEQQIREFVDFDDDYDYLFFTTTTPIPCFRTGANVPNRLEYITELELMGEDRNRSWIQKVINYHNIRNKEQIIGDELPIDEEMREEQNLPMDENKTMCSTIINSRILKKLFNVAKNNYEITIKDTSNGIINPSYGRDKLRIITNKLNEKIVEKRVFKEKEIRNENQNLTEEFLDLKVRDLNSSPSFVMYKDIGEIQRIHGKEYSDMVLKYWSKTKGSKILKFRKRIESNPLLFELCKKVVSFDLLNEKMFDLYEDREIRDLQLAEITTTKKGFKKYVNDHSIVKLSFNKRIILDNNIEVEENRIMISSFEALVSYYVHLAITLDILNVYYIALHRKENKKIKGIKTKIKIIDGGKLITQDMKDDLALANKEIDTKNTTF